MQSILCQELIEFDALSRYHAEDIQRLLAEVEVATQYTVVVLKNAHYLTTKAFGILYEYLQKQPSKDVVFILVSSDRSRIFPPLLEYVKLAG
ncbi:hypothetical protein [Argonema galeatum]|uniref:hypothetical protein n=1 Tax=Argonema galeatum TaxID=2942762 RepID=UPI0020130915|nr:hypothetical protein [Argonema galeatum]MCL1463065.1 hypothetical protein [Argonema galeatum A003/A1]